MPVRSRGVRSARDVAQRHGRAARAAAGAAGRAPPARPAAGARSSTSVFHAPQPGHCPCQRGSAWPQSVQTRMVVGRAIGVSRLGAGAGRPRPSRATPPDPLRERPHRLGVALDPSSHARPYAPASPQPLEVP